MVLLSWAVSLLMLVAVMTHEWLQHGTWNSGNCFLNAPPTYLPSVSRIRHFLGVLRRTTYPMHFNQLHFSNWSIEKPPTACATDKITDSVANMGGFVCSRCNKSYFRKWLSFMQKRAFTVEGLFSNVYGTLRMARFALSLYLYLKCSSIPH